MTSSISILSKSLLTNSSNQHLANYYDITTVEFNFLNSTELHPGTYKMSIKITQNSWTKVSSFNVVVPAPAVIFVVKEHQTKSNNTGVSNYIPST